MKRLTNFVLLFAVATIPAQLIAHEDHEHKMMGTVTAVDASQIEVEMTDGKKATVLLSKETKYLRGKTPVTAAEIKVGERIVVIFVEKDDKKMAKEIRLAAAGKDTGASANEPPGN